MKNNILIIIVVTLVAVAVIAAVIITGFVKDSESSSVSDSIPDWGASLDGSSDIGQDIVSNSEDASDNSSYSSVVSLPEYSSTGSVQSSSTSSENSVVLQPSVSDNDLSAAKGIVATANSLIGVSFVLGGDTPDGFDNPGFIYYVLRENGFHNCPHSVEKQSKMGTQLEYSEMKAGDLVFFMNDEEDMAAFGGVYIGNGMMVASLTPTNREHGVMAVDITTPYYQTRFFCGVALS